jgi:hypothetical protein
VSLRTVLLERTHQIPSTSMSANLVLVWPAREYLPSYAAALERGWSPDNIRGIEATREQLAAIARDPQAFLASLVVRAPNGALMTLPGWREGAAPARLSALVVGWRALRLDRLSLAAWHE